MLLGQMKIRVGDFFREHKAVVFHASGFPQFLNLLRAQHFSQGVRRIDGAVGCGNGASEQSLRAGGEEGRQGRRGEDRRRNCARGRWYDRGRLGEQRWH